MSSFMHEVLGELDKAYSRAFHSFEENEKLTVDDRPVTYRPQPKAKQQIPGLNGG